MSNTFYIEEMKKENLSLLAVWDDTTYKSSYTGIKPILDGLENDPLFFKDASIYDKVIGKAAAMLFIRSKVKRVYGEVMSVSAVSLFQEYGVECSFHTLTDRIINRKKDDICPMEKTVQNINSLDEAYIALKERLKQLNS